MAVSIAVRSVLNSSWTPESAFVQAPLSPGKICGGGDAVSKARAECDSFDSKLTSLRDAVPAGMKPVAERWQQRCRAKSCEDTR